MLISALHKNGDMKQLSNLIYGPLGWFLTDDRPCPGIENQVLVHTHSSQIVASIDDYADDASVLLTPAKLRHSLIDKAVQCHLDVFWRNCQLGFTAQVPNL